MTDKRIEQLVKQIEGKCIHFTGLGGETCRAGINYRELAGQPELGMALRLPCIYTKSNPENSLAHCDFLCRTTRDEAVAEAKEIIESSGKTMAAMRAAHADAKSKGLGKGNGGTSKMQCPLKDCSGELRYSVAALNGHMHAQCTVPTCVRWME